LEEQFLKRYAFSKSTKRIWQLFAAD